MSNRSFLELGRQFYEWHRDGRVRLEYGGHSKDLELEVERLAGLIDYVEKKREAINLKKG
ncbi:MAG: hypothetical protein WCO69_00290 [Candidatus Omnitrophota bacterium]